MLDTYRAAARTEREKGTYFEEPSYRDLYSDIWTYSDWAGTQNLDRRDNGIDLVAQTRGTQEFYAIQCKLYAQDHRIRKYPCIIHPKGE